MLNTTVGIVAVHVGEADTEVGVVQAKEGTVLSTTVTVVKHRVKFPLSGSVTVTLTVWVPNDKETPTSGD